MPNTSGLAVKVGIFVMIAMVMLIGFSLRVTDGFNQRNRYTVDAYFQSAMGLAPGSAVSLGGVVVGDVIDIQFDPARRAVRTVLSLRKDVPVPSDSVARIERNALLGNAIVAVDYGTAQPITDGQELPTEEVPSISDAVRMVGNFAEKVEDFMASFQDEEGGLFKKLEMIVDENREDLRTTTEALAQAAPKLDALAEELKAITDDVRGGQGTIGRLFTDETLFEDLKAFSQIGQDLRDGDGTLSRLIYDDAIAVRAEESLEKLGAAGDEIQNLLSSRREELDSFLESMGRVGPELEAAVADLREMSEKLNSTEGTMGRLINDPALYDDTRRAVNTVSESFENSEEQGVIRSFLGLLFGAMI